MKAYQGVAPLVGSEAVATLCIEAAPGTRAVVVMQCKCSKQDCDNSAHMVLVNYSDASAPNRTVIAEHERCTYSIAYVQWRTVTAVHAWGKYSTILISSIRRTMTAVHARCQHSIVMF